MDRLETGWIYGFGTWWMD